jgi:glycosyltransferase involved in cell wall biosynthesis
MDFGGPAEIVDAEVGWKVPASGPEVAIRGLTEALREAFDDPEGAVRRGRTARARVLERYTWEAKMREASKLYSRLAQPVLR